MSGIKIGNDTPFEAMSALVGGVDGKQDMGESQQAAGANPLGPLGDLINQVGGIGGLLKLAGPILGGLGI